MKSKKRQIPDSGIYAVIGRDACAPQPLPKIAKECIAAGVKLIQLRDKADNIHRFYKDALLVKNSIGRKALFIVNDRADIARLTRADGVHLGQYDLPVRAARKILGPGAIIGKSCHSLRQAFTAQKEGCDYVSIGPIFSTPTKPEYKAVGIQLLGAARTRLRIPVVAIGGINKKNAKIIRARGVNLLAVVRAVCKAKNIRRAVSALEGK